MRWLNRERLTVYPRIFVAFYLICGAILLGSAARSQTGLMDLLGRPVGTDFPQFWVASAVALAGDPAAVYHFPEFLAAQKALLKISYPFPWVYPPTGLLLVLPLALLPYLASLGVWLAATLGAYVAVLRRMAPHPLAIWLVLGFPGTFENLFHGQNGFLTTALVGGGLLLLDHAPVAGGFLLGLVSFKPHLMVLIPIALMAGRRWKALAALLAGVLSLAGSSYLVLGGEVWLAFLRHWTLPMRLVEQGLMPVNKMITPFAAILMAGFGLKTALVIQVCVMAGAAAAVGWIWRRDVPLAGRGSALVLGILLFTPHAFPYDLALLALPLAWLGWEGDQTGWRPGEPGLLCLGWLLPIIAPMLAMIKCQLTPLILAVFLILVVKSHKTPAVRPR